MLIASGSFVPYGAGHIAALAVILLAAVLLNILLRPRAPGKTDDSVRRAVCHGLAGVLTVNFLFEQSYSLVTGVWSVEHTLPLHLCDISVLLCIAALFVSARRSALVQGIDELCEKSAAGGWHQRHRWLNHLYELVYYWGLGGALQALLTPDVDQGFPAPLFFTYFIAHGCILTSVGVLTLGLGLRPRAGSLWRVWLTTHALAAVVLPIDWLLGANYMFLMGPTGSPSVLDYLGDWPWPYLLNLDLLALGCIWIGYAPFAFKKRGAKRAA